MVFAFAGDSTITSDVEPAGAGVASSSAGTVAATLRPRAFVAAFFFAAGRRRGVLAAGRAALPRPATRRVTTGSSVDSDDGSFFRAILSVNGSVIGRRAGRVVP